MKLALIYRGPLASCNYRCSYCPIPKRRATVAEAVEDARALDRFVALVASRSGDELQILFAPRGEALVHARYGDALRVLSKLPQVRLAAIQTNLSFEPDALDGCEPSKVALWATFHPEETSVARFAPRIQAVSARGFRLSAGAVADPRWLEAIEVLRRALPDDVYLWLNRRHGSPPLAPRDLARVSAIDPWFVAIPPRSRGRACHAGRRALVVSGDGSARRCLALPSVLGDVYREPLEAIVARSPASCPAAVCRCHVGQVFLEPLGLEDAFGDGLLARIPTRWRTPNGAMRSARTTWQ